MIRIAYSLIPRVLSCNIKVFIINKTGGTLLLVRKLQLIPSAVPVDFATAQGINTVNKSGVVQLLCDRRVFLKNKEYKCIVPFDIKA